jgi:hypothetical protein
MFEKLKKTEKKSKRITAAALCIFSYAKQPKPVMILQISKE